MSQLTIDPDLSESLDWKVGQEYTFPVTAKMVGKTSDGTYHMEVSDVQPESEAPTEDAAAGDTGEDQSAPPAQSGKGSSAVMAMLGK